MAETQYVVVAWGYTAFCDSLEAARDLLRQDAERGAKYGYDPNGVIFARVDPPPGSMPVMVDAAEFHRVVEHCEELQRELHAKHGHHAATCEALRKCQSAYTEAAEARDRANMRANKAAGELVRLRGVSTGEPA